MERMTQANLTLQSPSPALEVRPQPQTGLDNLTRAFKRISDYRLTMGWLALAFWIVSALSLDWDAQWHANVGRDGFWTPPHWAFYSTVTITALICVVVILTETFLFYRHSPAVTDKSSTSVLFVFRGPVGFILAGFGMLVMLISAPFDDYFHRIYGVDLAIWTPFHVMLMLGVNMAGVGFVYLFASEVNRRKLAVPATNQTVASMVSNLRGLFTPAILGLVVATVLLLSRFLFLMDETFIGNTGPGTINVANYKLPAYSVLVAGLPLVLVALVVFTGRIGIATLTGLLFLLFRFLSGAFVEWGIQTLAVSQGLVLRTGGARDIGIISTAYPVFLGLAGLVVDGIYLLAMRWRSKAGLGRQLLVAAGASTLAGLVLFLLEKPWESYNAVLEKAAAGITSAFGAGLVRQKLFHPDYWQALPLVLVVGALAGVFAIAVATSLRYTDR